MKKTAHNLRIILCAAALLLTALSPLMHGLHLFFCSHTHDECIVCAVGDLSHNQNRSDFCHGSAKGISFHSGAGRHGGHNPETCPLCRQFTQLLKNQIILPVYAEVILLDCYPEKQTVFSGDFIRISFSNINPRAPPCLSS